MGRRYVSACATWPVLYASQKSVISGVPPSELYPHRLTSPRKSLCRRGVFRTREENPPTNAANVTHAWRANQTRQRHPLTKCWASGTGVSQYTHRIERWRHRTSSSAV
jgi:hypothetical protein